MSREAEAQAHAASDDLERLYRETVEVEAIIERLAAAGLRVTFDLQPGGVDVCVRDLSGAQVMQLTPRDAVELDRLRALVRA